MKSFLKRLWTWYGIRNGYLNVESGFTLQGINGVADSFVWRGELVEGTRTAIFSTNPVRILVWNRVLSDAEIELVRNGPPVYDKTHGAIMPSVPPMGKENFDTKIT